MRASIGARAAFRLGLFVFWLVPAVDCAPRDPAAIAKAADTAAGSGVYTWLTEHDPSAIVVVGIDPSTTRAVAPDAHVSRGNSVIEGCKRALEEHALLAVLARNRTPDRDRADDCGFALFRDDATIVVAPR